MGITHHEHGVANVQSIVNLALLRGMVGRPGAGVLPIRGHSNVQGIGSVGVVPNLKQQILDNLENHLGIELPRTPGLDTMACMRAAEAGRMRSAFCLGGNLFGSNPDSAFARQALGKLELVTYLNTTLNTGHALGRGRETLILPVLARDEEPQPTTQESMFNFVRLSAGKEHRLEGPRSEVAIVAEIAERVLGSVSPVDWQRTRQHDHIRGMIAAIIPGFAEIEKIHQSKREFHIAGRILHTPSFPTPSGRANFLPHPLPNTELPPAHLRLMTVRSEGQFNTVVYEEEDIYRGQDRRDVILLNRTDIERLGLRVNQRVTVRSVVGVLPGILVREFDIRAGNALMYFPEANVLVPSRTDPHSHTPAFKNVLIWLEKAEADRTRLPLLGDAT
jgi:molybdopterin-dependent oxidoreductase alpha subunit